MGTAKGYLFENGPRTAVLTISLGKRFGLTEEDFADLFFAAVLANLGMIGLVEEAWEDPVPVLSVLRGLAPGCRHHHERWDGNGYPEELSGERIPIAAPLTPAPESIRRSVAGRSRSPRA